MPGLYVELKDMKSHENGYKNILIATEKLLLKLVKYLTQSIRRFKLRIHSQKPGLIQNSVTLER